MELKTVGVDGELKVGDEVRFVFETTDGSGCLVDPYQVVDVTIYFVTREFTDTTATEYSAEFLNPSLSEEYESLKREICDKAKETVKASSSDPLVLSGLQTVDGIPLSVGDRILVKDQTDHSENGIYVVSDSEWSRSLDASSERNVVSGMYLFVENGLENMGTGWVLESPDPVRPGYSEMRFVKFANQWSPSSPDGREEDKVKRLATLERMLADSKLKSSFFYKDAVPVKKFGGDVDSTGEIFPAWLNPDRVPSELRTRVASDNILSRVEEGEDYAKGKFELSWDTGGMREGDYFVCWRWRPSFGSETLSAHHLFQISGDGNATASIPTHRSRPDKYEILMDRYMPEMFKTRISDSDLSPEVISEFGKSVAQGFSFVENQAGAVIDLLDANVVQEQLLPLLANMFNLKVKSGDPTLWRRQIKKAVPNFKRKGSVAGLREVLEDSGMRLLRLARMWQVVPKYTFQEHFDFSGSYEFGLSRVPVLPLDDNFKLWYRPASGGDWVELDGLSSSSSSSDHWSSDFIEISGDVMNWVGSELSVGDSLRVLYKFRSLPLGEQANEDYVRSLPLMDDRDERDQKYPPKNWNVHLIEEDDIFFDRLVPVRHPLADPIVWGRVRTEFPYSENLYNMEEYNGSKRDSFNPCDIDKEFLDSCGQCASSKFNMDVEVDMLSDDSFKELRQIVEENMPFHALPNSFNLWGGVNEFVGQVDEEIRAMVSFSSEEVLLAGEGQRIFHRSLYPEEFESIRRNLLARMESLENPSTGSEDWMGTLKNTRTVLLSMPTNSSGNLASPDFDGMTQGFDSLNVRNDLLVSDPFDSDNLVEIFGSTTRYYSILSMDRSSAELYGNVDASLVGPLLEYRVSNRIEDFNVNIEQYQETIFGDEDSDFSIVGIVSRHDIDVGLATGEPWTLLFEDKRYFVENVLPDGTLSLSLDGNIAPVSGWELRDGLETVKTGSGGFKEVYNYGLVSVNSAPGPLREIVRPGDFVYMDWTSSPKIYEIRSFRRGEEKFYLKDYSEGGMGGEDVKVYRRVMDRKLGQIDYDGLFLVSDDPIPVSDDDLQDHLVFVGGEYYNIVELEGNIARLSGPKSSEDTSGSPVEFKIYKFSKENLTLPGKLTPPYDEEPPEYELQRIGRSGGAIITSTEGGSGAVSAMLNSNEPLDIVTQGETIEYNIEYKKE